MENILSEVEVGLNLNPELITEFESFKPYQHRKPELI